MFPLPGQTLFSCWGVFYSNSKISLHMSLSASLKRAAFDVIPPVDHTVTLALDTALFHGTLGVHLA